VSLQPGDGFARLRQSPPKLQHQARFAHPGLAADAHDLPSSGLDFTEPLPQCRELPLPANEGRQAALHGHVEAATGAAGLEDLEGAHRGTPLHRQLA
jgi:hypothetical protein